MGGVNLSYEERLALLDGADFFALFSSLGVKPRWVHSGGKQSIQIIGACHHGEGYSALFDPTTLKVTCFSACGQGMYLHTWIQRALDFTDVNYAKDFIMDWIDGEELDLDNRSIVRAVDFSHTKQEEYKPEHIEPLQGIDKSILQEIYADIDTSIETLSKLVWATKDGIKPEILKEFDIGFHRINKTIVLPHHNINGEIIGLYERSFKTLRKQVKAENPDIDYKSLLQYPRAKYVPMLRKPKWQTEEKSSWSFPNTFNLYGLHKAKEAIKETGIAIIFEGAKSTMLAHEYGYPFAVASHTFGANLNHISMLIECGAKEIILAFDKQYKTTDSNEWDLYERKTKDLANKVKDYVIVSRIVDKDGSRLNYKEAPIDRGKPTFDYLYSHRERLTLTEQEENYEQSRLELNLKLTPQQLKERDIQRNEGQKWRETFQWNIP